MQNFTNRMFCLTKIEVRNSFDIRQYGRVGRLKRLCDQGGAYNSRWIAAAERKQSPAKPHRNRRRWNQLTREIDDVFQVVFQTGSVIQELGDVIGVFIREADCSVYTGIESLVFAECTTATSCARSASIRASGSPFSSAPGASLPTNKAPCDQVDCVRYFIAELNRRLPSTSSMSPLRSGACNSLSVLAA